VRWPARCGRNLLIDAFSLQGSLRVDANVSVRRAESIDLGARCEIKNLNGVRLMVGALEYEIDRHISLLESSSSSSGGESAVRQETRGYDSVSGKTYALRSKEDAPDYRYMPDPELPALVIPSVCSIVKLLPARGPRFADPEEEHYRNTSRICQRVSRNFLLRLESA
jgi:Asp-tRNA(Asn)/Glu-tRNA(Gln) amidotransferase B subunit